jgi:hypothetical protein
LFSLVAWDFAVFCGSFLVMVIEGSFFPVMVFAFGHTGSIAQNYSFWAQKLTHNISQALAKALMKC